MPWIDVTTVDNVHDPDTITKHTINTDHIVRVTELEDGNSRLYFSVATDKSQLSLPVRESREQILKEIRKQEAGIKPPA